MRAVCAAALIALLLPGSAHAQGGPVQQSGAMTPGHPSMFITNGVIGDGGPALAGKLKELGITNTGTPFCINDAPITGPYHQLCLGAFALGGAIISYDAHGGAPSAPFQICLNGNCYPFPPTGNGNVLGPSPTAISEIASFNNTTGTLLRQGPARASDSQTAGITLDGYALQGGSQVGLTANNIYGSHLGGVNYDAVRGVANVAAGTTALNVDGVGGYVRNLNASGATGNAVALYGYGTAEVANAATWGINTNIIDGPENAINTQPGHKLIGYEADISVMSAGTSVTGVALLGSSLIQPTFAQAFIVGSLGGPAQWDIGFGCTSGVIKATGICMIIGSTAVSGSNIGSQETHFEYLDAAAAGEYWRMGVNTAGNFFFTDTGAGHALSINDDLILGPPKQTAPNTPSPNLLFQYFDSTATVQNYQFDVATSGVLGLNSTGTANAFALTMDLMIGPNTPLSAGAAAPFVYLSTVAAMPNGTPTYRSPGHSAITIDTADHKLCWFENASSLWKCVTGS